MFLNILLSEAAGSATEAATNAGDKASTGSSWWIYLILVVLVIAMLVLPSITNRRRVKEYNQMVDRLRVGDEVRTIGGIIGRVTRINRNSDNPTFVLETGAKGSKTTMEFDVAAVGTVLKSNYVETEEDLKDKKAKKGKDEKAVEENKTETPEVANEEAVEVKENVTEEAPKQETDYSAIEKQVSGKATGNKKASKKKK